MDRLDKLWIYGQVWEYCDEIKSENCLHIRIPRHFKKDYVVNYIPFMFPRTVYKENKLLKSQLQVHKTLLPLILLD